jgi:hypothetical protein
VIVTLIVLKLVSQSVKPSRTRIVAVIGSSVERGHRHKLPTIPFLSGMIMTSPKLVNAQ